MNAELDETPDNPQEEAAVQRPLFATLTFRACAILLLVGLIAFVVWQYRDVLSLDDLASQENNLRAYQAERPFVVYLIAGGLFLVSTATGLPITATLIIVFGWLFPFLPAFLLSSFGATGGATLTFLSSRYLFRDAIQQWFGGTLERFDRELQQEGPFYLFVSRLIPQVPFVLVNVLMGLTPIRLRTFWIVSQASMVPATLVYLWIGTSLPSLQTIADEGLSAVISWQLLAGMAAMGLVPLAIRLSLRWLLAKRTAA